ncbi:MAG: glycosyltransferase [Bacteroidetes bacterium]|nr:glycosyltransferase [Bacteroidota bacterium]
MDLILEFIIQLIINSILVYSIAICVAYAILAIISAISISDYLRRNKYIDYSSILSSSLAPSISIVAPAYNEGMTIIQNVRSLLNLQYAIYEVIIINDGSKDDTLEKLMEEYDLVPVEILPEYDLPTKQVYGVYQSRNAAFGKLKVIDKQNGGKADALNVGLNYATHKIVLCADVDCIIDDLALLKVVKPFMEDRKRLIASGAVVSIANSCKVEKGRLMEVHVPENFLARVQVLEYLRAFLMGRMAWSKLDGLLLVSGAFGLFDKEIARNAGGYDTETVGEDMELVVRMRKYMIENGLEYSVIYVPDPLCWTEAPSSYKVLGNQRSRWTRGTIETLLKHRKIFFNPQFGFLGMVSYPFWFFFEWLAPWVEIFGLLFFIVLALLGFAYWSFFFSLLAIVFSYATTLTLLSILFEEISFNQYKGKRDIVKLALTALVESFVYHPLTVYWSIRGNYQFFSGMKQWGEMIRTGFAEQNTKSQETEIHTVPDVNLHPLNG